MTWALGGAGLYVLGTLEHVFLFFSTDAAAHTGRETARTARAKGAHTGLAPFGLERQRVAVFVVVAAVVVVVVKGRSPLSAGPT